ncbi:MAG: DNA gyrase subunit A [Vampirovibrionales bacterium]
MQARSTTSQATSPPPSGGSIQPISLREEMRRSYIDYAMSVIVGRALPDVRDGLKPVHRRILYAMHELGLTPDKPYKKAAKVVGEVLGKYHPHGDSAVYDALVRLAQDFSSRYPLIDGHGNFGSIEGDNAAAMRYTEVRLSKAALPLLEDIEQDTVDFSPNYDGSEEEPSVLPARLPMLLLNGASGIAVGMATNIPPFNAKEVIDALLATIQNPAITTPELLKLMPAPDFPTGASIIGQRGVRDAYETGRGSVMMRATTTIDVIPGGHGRHERNAIIVTEIPYQVNLTSLIEKIAELVRDKKLEGISDLRNESDRDGLRLVIELKRDADANVVLRNLYKQTQLQSSFGVMFLALVDNQPRLLSVREILHHFIEHRVTVVTRRTNFQLAKAEARAHILLGLLTAMNSLDEIIKTIRAASSTEEARQNLMSRFALSEVQAQAILEMQLRRLTALERDKVQHEYDELQKTIAHLLWILSARLNILGVIQEELEALKVPYGEPRRTRLLPDEDGSGDFTMEDLVPDTPMSVFITKKGYIKRVSLNQFKRQNRATRGAGGMKTREEDEMAHLLTTSMHGTILLFSNRGVVYSLRVFDLPEGGKNAKGLALINLLPLQPDEKITAVLPLQKHEGATGTSLIMLTQQGVIKRTLLEEFQNIRRNGLIAIGLNDGDELKWVLEANDLDSALITTANGMAIRFAVKDELRPMGRPARGVKAIELRRGDDIVDFCIAPAYPTVPVDILVITNDGYGKRCDFSEFRLQSRGGIGLIATKFKSRTSQLASACIVSPDDEIMIVSAQGIVNRLKSQDISQQGRMATGVKLQSMDDADYVVMVSKISSIYQQDDDQDTDDTVSTVPEG